MANGYVKKNAVSAKTDNAKNRRGVNELVAVQNGSVQQLLSYSTTTGESNVWVASTPTASAGLTNLWMAATEGVVSTTSGTKVYKGLSNDPRDFTNLAGEIMDLFKPVVGDIVEMTADAIGGTKSSNEYIVATAGEAKLQWGSAAVSGLSLKLKDEQFLSIGLGGIGTQRVTTYRFEVVEVA